MNLKMKIKGFISSYFSTKNMRRNIFKTFATYTKYATSNSIDEIDQLKTHLKTETTIQKQFLIKKCLIIHATLE